MLDPLETTSRIDDAYKGYLRSAFGPRRPDLRKAYFDALDDQFELSRGPIVQATAPFVQGRSVRQLVDDGVLSGGFLQLEHMFPLDRPLHLHQEQAVVKSVAQGRNLVVSTGTGSGKTESFLIPVLDHLFREQEAGTLGTPGVRALLLYPMNALANDQVKRLRELLSAVPQVQFGRYTGETKRTQKEAEDDFRLRFPGAKLLPNELISRERMQEGPPHMLLTNYAMLEYLLLRPADSAFFDGPHADHWKFLVLDEAHVYNGAQGTEVAYLLRRLRDRVLQSSRGVLRCFATSATMGEGESDNPDLVKFAEDLFDESFVWDAGDERAQDVVSATRLPLVSAGEPRAPFSPDQIDALHAAFRAGLGAADLRVVAGAPVGAAEEPVAVALHELLRDDARVRQAQAALLDGAMELSDLARLLFGNDSDGPARAVQLVDLCVNARHVESDNPLLPARYHHFVRSLDGAFVCLHPDHPSGEPRISLVRRDRCPACESRGGSALQELVTCRSCRAEFVLGTPDQRAAGHARLARSNEFDAARRYFLLGTNSAEDLDGDEDEVAVGVESEQLAGGLELCPACGCVTRAGAACDCVGGPARQPVTMVEPADGANGAVRCCPSCAARTRGEMLTRFVTGTEAPVTVVATELYQQLPPSSDAGAADQLGHGRKLLTFSDSRQDAAFFAGYIERTYGRSMHRSLIWDALQAGPPGMRVGDVIAAVKQRAEAALVLDPDDGNVANVGEAGAWVLEELLALDRRQSLEGVGLVRVSVAIPRRFTAPQPLLDLGLTADDVVGLVQLLLGTLRASAVVTAPTGVDIRSDRFSPRNREFFVRPQQAQGAVLAWRPSGNNRNRRVDLLEKVFAAKQIDADPVEVLSNLWDHFADPNGPWASTLVGTSEPRHGAVWRLDVERFELSPVGNDQMPFRCDTCARLSWWNVGDVCPGWKCPGQLTGVGLVEDLVDEHYARLYRRLEPIAMAAEEHTAQWTAREAAAIQDRFVNGDLNVLSCSTTFEMGVDVGDVQAVLLRNVPPHVANYVQRAGRAGRRTDAAALVVTYAQRRNHDRTYFDNPTAMIEGFVPVPAIKLSNFHIGRRHVHSVAFARFLRTHVDGGGEDVRTVGEFFPDPVGGSESVAAQFEKWLRARPPEVLDALRRLLPEDVARRLLIEEFDWVPALFEISDDDPTEGWFHRARQEIRGELRVLAELRDEAASVQDAGALQRYQGIEKTIRSQQLLGFLAGKNVLPKYGFPVDVVELNVRGSGHHLSGKINLNRDLRMAVSDYAPGSFVVAGKQVWQSVGLGVRSGHQWKQYSWAVCRECGAFRSGLLAAEPTCQVCDSSMVERGKKGTYVVPSYGFVGRAYTTAGESRPVKTGYAEPYFSTHEVKEFQPVAGLAGVSMRLSRQGTITVINRNRGAGYGLCEWCGAGVQHAAVRKAAGGGSLQDNLVDPAAVREGLLAGGNEHDDIRRSDRKCHGPVKHFHLGHQYLTDVVELKFDVPFDRTVADSVLYALVEGVRDLGIDREEVDGAQFIHAAGASPGIVLFDTVPGGAGHCHRIAERVPELVERALRRVSHCSCGPETSCYGCLRSYSNQRVHEKLSRGAAASVLNALLV